MNDETLIYYGGDVKALGSGKVGGYLVRFGSPESADVQGDYFAPDTYFGRAVKSGMDVVYHHGVGKIDPLANRLGNAIIGEGVIQSRADGLYIEATVTEPEVYTKAEAGLLGWSSGSVDRLVKRESVKAGVTKIKQWPLIEASLSPRPVDPRNKAFAIKALIESPQGEGTASGTLAEQTEALVSRASELAGLYGTVAEAHKLNASKRSAIKGLIESLDTLYRESAPKPDPGDLARIKLRLLADRLER